MQNLGVICFLFTLFGTLASPAQSGPADWIPLYQFAAQGAGVPGNQLQFRYTSVLIEGKKYLRPEIEMIFPVRKFAYKLFSHEDYDSLKADVIVSFSADQDAIRDHGRLLQSAAYKGHLQINGGILESLAGNIEDISPIDDSTILRHTFAERAPTTRTFLTLSASADRDQPPLFQQSYVINSNGAVSKTANLPLDDNTLYFGGDLLSSQNYDALEFLGIRLFVKYARDSSIAEYLLVSDEGWIESVHKIKMQSAFTPTYALARITKRTLGAVTVQFVGHMTVPWADVSNERLIGAPITLNTAPIQWEMLLGPGLSQIIQRRFQEHMLETAEDYKKTLDEAYLKIHSNAPLQERIDLIENALNTAIYLRFLDTGLAISVNPNEVSVISEIIAGSSFWDLDRAVPMVDEWIMNLIKVATDSSLLSGQGLLGETLEVHLLSSNLCSLIVNNPGAKKIIRNFNQSE